MLPRQFLLLLLVPVLAFAAPEYNWEKLENCTLIASKWNDGDSFHVRHAGKEYIFRLYFVDTPETDTRFPDRIAEQGAYFGCSSDRALEVGNEAEHFSVKLLESKPFVVWTLWQDARGASKLPRFYAVIETSRGSLADLLVENGLARIYGKRIQLPDGTISISYLKELATLKEEAMAAKRGGWGAAGEGGGTVEKLEKSAHKEERQSGLDSIPVF